MAASARNAAFISAKSRASARRACSSGSKARSNRATAWCSTPASRRKRRKADGFTKSKVRSPNAPKSGRATELRASATATLISPASTSATSCGRRATRTRPPVAPEFCRRHAEVSAPIEWKCTASAGKPLTLIARDERATWRRSSPPCRWPRPKTAAHDRTLREQLGRLGGTPFRLGELKNYLDGRVMLPVSELNRLRREAVAELERLRAQPKRWTLNDREADARRRRLPLKQRADRRQPRSAAAAPALDRAGPQSRPTRSRAGCGVDDDLLRIRGSEEIPRCRDAVPQCGVPANPQIRHRHNLGNFRRLRRASSNWARMDAETGPLLRRRRLSGPQLRPLEFFANDRRIGDYSLNIANRLAADYFKNSSAWSASRRSYDLNFQQLEALLRAAPPEWFEVTLHQHMPMFHMEHCVFCAFLSTARTTTNCGRRATAHDVRLRDRVGAEHPVKADAGCRNTVFNALAQTGAEYVSRHARAGRAAFPRGISQRNAGAGDADDCKYRQLLRGEITGAQLWRELKLFNQLGVTRGQMGKPVKFPNLS